MAAALPSSNRTPVRRTAQVAAPLRKQVIELLRDAIASMEFEPGQRLVERDLCERFDVSRTVIREALRHLEAEGLVDLVANHGPVVSRITREDAGHIYEARATLEGVIARYAAERATPPAKKRMWNALTRLETAYGRPI
jgi:DNA-binding GntR family transcriptional regulator